jgi:cytochrome c oxidase subunit 2
MIGVGNFILAIVIGIFAAICLFILVLLARLMLRRNALSHSTPAHSTPGASPGRTPGQFMWTATLPVIVALVAVPALRIWYFENTVPVADLTVQMTGKMWSWTYQYPDYGNLIFVAPMLSNPSPGTGGELGRPGADNHIVVPVGKTVRIVTMGGSLIYSWAIPSIGAKVTALPGQTNQSWFKPAKEGRYYGKCFELCGLPHVFKPIEVEVVSPQRFDRWAAEMRLRLAATKTATRAPDER